MTGPSSVGGSNRQPSLTSLIVCEHCDAVWTRPSLSAGEFARCGRCDAILKRAPWISLSGQLSLVITGIIVFVIANAAPIVVLDIQGLRHGSTLLGALLVLSQHDAVGVAIVAGVTVFICPLVELLIRAWALINTSRAQTQKRYLGIGQSLRLLNRVQRWSMTEVYMIGILITAVKLGSIAQVIPGIGIMSFGMLTVVIAAIRSAGTDGIWEKIDLSQLENTSPQIGGQP